MISACRPLPAALALAFVGVVAVAIAGCSPSTPSGSLARSAAPVATSSVGVSPSAGATSPAPGSAGPGAVVVDPGLLRFVTPAPDGITLTFDPDTTAQVAADPTLAASAARLAVGLYTATRLDPSALPGADDLAVVSARLDPSALPGADDLAVVSVVDLRNPAADEDWFRNWRDSYDEAACANAGGVVRHAETQVVGLTVFVGSCAGGAFTYHLRKADVGIVVSLTSVGPGRIGEKIVQGIGGG